MIKIHFWCQIQRSFELQGQHMTIWQTWLDKEIVDYKGKKTTIKVPKYQFPTEIKEVLNSTLILKIQSGIKGDVER